MVGDYIATLVLYTQGHKHSYIQNVSTASHISFRIALALVEFVKSSKSIFQKATPLRS